MDIKELRDVTKPQFSNAKIFLAFVLAAVMGCSAAGPEPIPSPYVGLTLDELVSHSGQPSYKTLMRRTEDYKGCLVAYRGEVSQVLSRDNDAYQISVNITKGEYDWWDDAVLLIYSTDRGPRALDGDIVDFSGTVGELWETENLMGAPLFLPVIHVLALELELSLIHI